MRGHHDYRHVCPGQTSAAHRHHAQFFVNVLAGSVVMQVAGGEAKQLGPGETFYEKPSDIQSRHFGQILSCLRKALSILAHFALTLASFAGYCVRFLAIVKSCRTRKHTRQPARPHHWYRRTSDVVSSPNMTFRSRSCSAESATPTFIRFATSGASSCPRIIQSSPDMKSSGV